MSKAVAGAVVGGGRGRRVIHVLDVARVHGESLDRYLQVLLEEYLPGARQRGLRLEGVWRTPPEVEPPSVTVLWAVDGWEDWARARSLASLDAAVAACARRLRELCIDSSRQFLLPVDSATAAPR